MDEKIFEVGTIDQNEVKALAAATAGLSFTSSGNHLIYCDNPESMTCGANTLACMWGASVGTAYKDVELYAHLWNGYGSAGAIRYGIAIQNTTGSAVTITYKCAAAKADSGVDNAALTITDQVQYDWITGSTRTMSVAAGAKVFLCGQDTTFKGSGYSATVNFHASIKASVASGVYFRVFVAGANKKTSMTELFSTTVSQWAAADSDAFFCGELGYSQKNCTVSANTTNTYMLNEWQPSKNSGEYTPVVQYKSGGKSVHPGNYGVIYKMTITNASGKKIKIIPYWENATKASAVARLNGGSWKKLTQIAPNGCWYMSLGTSSTATFEMILPGGNYGNMAVSFD